MPEGRGVEGGAKWGKGSGRGRLPVGMNKSWESRPNRGNLVHVTVIALAVC